MINEIQLISSFPLSCGIGSCHIAVGTEKNLGRRRPLISLMEEAGHGLKQQLTPSSSYFGVPFLQNCSLLGIVYPTLADHCSMIPK